MSDTLAAESAVGRMGKAQTKAGQQLRKILKPKIHTSPRMGILALQLALLGRWHFLPTVVAVEVKGLEWVGLFNFIDV
jgi:hypothetical protein